MLHSLDILFDLSKLDVSPLVDHLESDLASAAMCSIHNEPIQTCTNPN